MAGAPYLVSEIIVGDLANKISIANDGSMSFTDPYVPTIKLKDILELTTPAITIYVDETDVGWAAQSVNSYGQTLYKISIPHNWGLTDINDSNNLLPITASVKVYDTDNKEIGVECIQCFANTVEITTTKKITIQVSIKKI